MTAPLLPSERIRAYAAGMGEGKIALDRDAAMSLLAEIDALKRLPEQMKAAATEAGVEAGRQVFEDRLAEITASRRFNRWDAAGLALLVANLVALVAVLVLT